MKKNICIIFISLFIIHPSTFCQTWQTYDSLRSVYLDKESYDTALVFAEKALQTVKEEKGENDTCYANMLTGIFQVSNFMGDYKKAMENSEKEREIRKKIQGEKHPDYANTLNNLAILYEEMGNYTAAESLYLEAKKIRKEVLGEKNPVYATTLSNLADLYKITGKFRTAEALFLETRKIYKETLGEKNVDYATNLNDLAALYDDMGNFKAAESLYLEAKQIYKEIMGENNSYYATTVNNLAQLYEETGNYSAAERMFLAINKNQSDKDPDYALSLNNLAHLYVTMGNYPAAEPLYIKAKNILKQTLGEKHPYYAVLLDNLAALYKAMGNYPAAELLFLESIKIKKESLGGKHLSYVACVNNLAELYTTMGNSAISPKDAADKFAIADSFYTETKNIIMEVIGKKHIYYPLTLNNTGSLYFSMGNAASNKKDAEEKYSLAEPLYLEALGIFKEILGENHASYAACLNNIALLYIAMGNYAKADSYFDEEIKLLNHSINQNFAFLSEKEKELYFKTKSNYYDGFYSFSMKRKKDNSEITKTVYNNVVKNKGLLLKSSTALRSAVLNSKDRSLINTYEKWISLKKEISKLYSTEIAKRTKNPDELEQVANTIEKDLVRRSQIISDFEKMQNLNWENVKNNLHPDEAAIEFLRFTEGKKKDTITYCALLITPQSNKPEMIRLFEEREINHILGLSDANNFSYINNIYGTNTNNNQALYKLIWQPIEPYLSGVKNIYYSPDGILHKISFAALCKGKNIFLCDKYNLHEVSSTAKVAIPENAIIGKNLTACIIGGIDYSADSSKNPIWQYLPGTLAEAIAINTLLSEKSMAVKFYSGKEATEETFKNIFSSESIHPDIMHIATHGFFYPDPEQIAKKEKTEKKAEIGLVAFRGGNSGFGLWQFVKNQNPLMRSGLVLSGANKVWSEPFSGTDNEGVLTAQEVTELDMSKTKLVVLSACETGLGDIIGSEGVYGLQRALKMAGVKFIIMSLWQVPDKETMEYMETFYTQLLKIKDIRKAYSETQKEMRQKYDPYFWAAFVLIE
jgi:CHAT domain-containing protein/Flp pilus assembly protein TadD